MRTEEERRKYNRERAKKWRKKNPDKHKAAVKRYRQDPKNAPKIREQKRLYKSAWRKNNPEKHREIARREAMLYRARHPERNKVIARRYYENREAKVAALTDLNKVLRALVAELRKENECLRKRNEKSKTKSKKLGGKLTRSAGRK